MSTPLPAYATAKIRQQNRVAQKVTRERRAEAGRPDPATLDRALADALRDCMAAAPTGRRLATALDPERIIRAAAVALLRRSHKALKAGKAPIVYRAEAVAAALANRLGLEI
ncbi:hypothetical protein [Methylobacterium sp. 37f]|uniref:hypothetical protein n=1 Tax=Methylobacterium sp. 37f TaxID=2817058 RepID=UPI001FFCA026|nr:hypothetical protein [Methylobacterium sp. 37f]MCK2057217.1 hypothetical protein [Methylobacterium sp. 37f]